MITPSLTYRTIASKQKTTGILVGGLALFMLGTICLDYLYARYHNTAFYISESLLFSMYWSLFLPILLGAAWLFKKTDRLRWKLLLVAAATIGHLTTYPVLVWMLSAMLYEHTFLYGQTFQFAISAYLIKTLLIYGFLFVGFINKPIKEEVPLKQFIRSILTSDTNNKKVVLQVDDILYFSASPPYVYIYHNSKKFLHTETLRSLEIQLDEYQFIRVHKSCIVNIHKIASIRSRQNGDYDITLLDDSMLRLSRNYAKNFKTKFAVQHQFTLK